MNMPQIIIIILIVLIVIGGFIIFTFNSEAERKKRVMSVIKGKNYSVHSKTSEADEQNKRRAEIAKKLKEAKESSGDDDKKKKATLSMLIAQAGLNISVRQFWMFSALSMVIVTVIAKFMGQSSFVLLMAAITGLLGVPRFVLKKKASKRQKNFLEEFPDALEATVRLRKACMPVSEAIKMISSEYDGPVGEEMSIIYDKQKIGIALPEAAFEATKRMPLPEMQMFATGLAIQAQTGSSLSEVLTNLSGVIRARFRLKRKIKALSSEAIASASIIAALPNIVALGLYFANREYIMVLFTTDTGKALLAGAVIWMLLGVFAMKIMINFKV